MTLVHAGEHLSGLDVHCLLEWFAAGHGDAAALTEQIKALGYRGSDKTVRRYLHPVQASMTAPPPVPIPRSVRQVTGWLTADRTP